MRSSGYRQVLWTPGVPGVLASATLGRLAYGSVPFAVVVATSRTAGFAAAGTASAALMFLIAATGPVRGRLVDQHGPTVLPGLAVACVGLLGAAAYCLGRVPWIVPVTLVGLGGALIPPTGGAARTAWSRLVADKVVLKRLHTLDSLVEETTYIVAPLLTTGLIRVVSAPVCLVCTAALLLPATVGLAHWGQLPAGKKAGKKLDEPGTEDRPKPLAAMLTDRASRGILIPLVALGIAAGAIGVLLPASAAKGGDVGAAGYAFAVFSAGGLAGGLLHDRRAWKSSIRSQYLAAAVLLVIALAIMIPVANGLLVIPAVFVVGLPMTPLFVLSYLLVDQHIDKSRQTEGNSWLSSGFNLGSAGGAVLAGTLLAHLGVGAITAIVSLAAFIAAACAWQIPNDIPSSAEVPADMTANAMESP